jgi:hypothetical protein
MACEEDPPNLNFEPPTTDSTDSTERFTSLDAAAEELGKMTGQPVRKYSNFDYGRQKDFRCRSVVLRSEDDPSEVAERLRPRIPLGYVIFVGTSRWREGAERLDGTEVVIGPGADQFDYLRLARTRGVNHGLDTEKISRRLARLNNDYGIEIVQAETDTVIFRFLKPPWNYTKVADEIYELCPDIVTRGTGTKEDLGEYLKTSAFVHLWWQ